MIQKFHPLRCPSCNASLTQDDTVNIHFSVAEREFDLVSGLDLSGLLMDKERLVANGYDVGTFCRACGKRLNEFEVKCFSWLDLHCRMAYLFGGDELPSGQDVTICDANGEFFRCSGFEQVTEDDVLDKGHWFLRVERV